MTSPVRFVRAAPRQLVTRMLEQPEIVALVRMLEPRTLARLIEHVGLEDSGELVALATTEQLGKVFDEDVWRSEAPGADERFDPDRFGLWLEVLLEAGEDIVAEKLAGLPEELVLVGLGLHMFVVDLDELGLELSDAGDRAERIEKALDASLCVEFDQYRVIARRPDGWDAIAGVLHALDARAPELFRSLLERLCGTSRNFIDNHGGLYDVLTGEEMLETDAAADREDRRAREGYVAPSAAISFLRLARATPLDEILATRRPDPVTHAYFRDLEPQSAHVLLPSEPPQAAELLRMLEQAREFDAPLPTLPVPIGTDGEPLFRRALVRLRANNPDAYDRRMHELAYLSNVLVAGCSFGDRRFRPLEAAEAAAAICNLGLGSFLGDAAALLAQERADKLFRIGWRLLHERVLLDAVATVTELLERRAGTERSPWLSRAVVEARAVASGTKPWRARRFVDDLAELLDDATRDRLAALLGELPLLVKGVDASRGFVTTHEEIDEVRRFLCGLREGTASARGP